MRTRAQQGGEWHVSDDLLVPDPCKEATRLLDAVVVTPPSSP
jgi:hypothetical protein